MSNHSSDESYWRWIEHLEIQRQALDDAIAALERIQGEGAWLDEGIRFLEEERQSATSAIDSFERFQTMAE